MAGFVLRVKTKSGQKVLVGYPPKPIDLDAADATIERAGIISGDTLIVEEKQIVFNRHEQRLDNLGRSHIVDQENFANAPGVLMRKVVPADNSCLFTSVGYVLNGKVDTSCASFMREIIANAVAADPNEYSEAFLGKPNVEYCEWILKSDAWGGAIELSILSKFYGLEIAVIDSINAIINRFGEDQHYAQRVFLIFDGIHYDPLYLEPLDGGSIQTIFPTEDERVLLEATQLAKEARSSRQFTDVQKFTLMCIDCKVMLSGQAAAQQHAKDTGHKNFGEVAA